MSTRLARAEVPVESTWDLDDLFADDEAWEAACRKVDELRQAIGRFQGQLGHDASTLLACLNAREALQLGLARVGSFARLRNAQDGTDARHQAALARVMALQARVDADLSFVDAEILALPEETLRLWRANESGLEDFRVPLEQLLEQRPHRLAPAAEQALAALGELLQAPSMIYNRSKAGDLQLEPFVDDAGARHANSFNGFESRWETHSDTTLRRKAWASFSAGLKAYRQTWAATFATEVGKNVALARLRGWAGAEDMLLQPHQVPRALYDHILDILQAGIAPHMRRYARLRRRVLGLERMLYCDIKVPLDPDFNPPMPWHEACRLILEALEPMGADYLGFVHRALTGRWVDRADNIGKSSGAFCASIHGVHPYILITWSDTLRNVFTLAHELGHGGHFDLAMRHQRLGHMRPAMPFVEAPSILNEMLLARHILDRSREPRLRRSVIMQVLGTYHHNFVTHLLEAELQRRIYALAEGGGAVTAAALDETQGRILERFWGDTVDLDDGARMTWMRQPHYYMGLYPYTYAVGLVASTAMARLIEREGHGALQRWLQVLAAGGTRKPLELMHMAGVDLASPQPIHDAVAHVGRLVDELEQSYA